jgi:putative acetyltransferase
MLRIHVDDLTRPQVLALIEEHLRNMHEISPPGHVFAFDVDKLKGPGVTFWTAWNENALHGCAALKELSPNTGEVKSMRTPVGLRRTGAGRALVDHVIQVARDRGYQNLFLETGRHPDFEPALTLYRSVGFSECGPFGSYSQNDCSVFMSLALNANRTACNCRNYR